MPTDSRINIISPINAPRILQKETGEMHLVSVLVLTDMGSKVISFVRKIVASKVN
jgi:hypothetical protein